MDNKRPHVHRLEVILGIVTSPTSLYFLTSIIILTAIILTGSRAGICSILLGSLVLLSITLYKFQKNYKGGHLWIKPVLLSAGILAFIGAAISFSGDTFFTRMGHLWKDNQRLQAYPYIIDAIRDRFWVGHGFGSFTETFRVYRSPGVDAYLRHAHNEYMELALAIGVPISLFGSLVFLWMLRQLGKATGQSGTNISCETVAIAASCQILSHALVDFPLQIPAVSFLFTTIIALACSSAARQLKP